MSKKGLTPIIAVILLLMMTVAAAGAAFYWIVRIQGQLQGGTEQYEETTFERMASTVNVLSADYNNATLTLNVTIFNAGTTDIPVTASTGDPAANFMLKNYNQTVICASKLVGSDASCVDACNTTLNPSEIMRIPITLAGSCAISGSAYSTGSMFYFDLILNGKATASGQFLK